MLNSHILQISLGSTFPVFTNFLENEPALLEVDPAPFAKLQSFVFLFYALPIQLISLFYAVFASQRPAWLWDLALINAGIFVQAQFTFIFTALDPQTPAELRSDWRQLTFWGNNLSLVIVPHIFLWMLYNNHHLKKEKGTSKKNKSN